MAIFFGIRRTIFCRNRLSFMEDDDKQFGFTFFLDTVYIFCRKMGNKVSQLVIFDNFKGNNNTNSHDDVYGAVVMTKSFSEFIHFM